MGAPPAEVRRAEIVAAFEAGEPTPDIYEPEDMRIWPEGREDSGRQVAMGDRDQLPEVPGERTSPSMKERDVNRTSPDWVRQTGDDYDPRRGPGRELGQ